jgi:hypothetical protein
MIRVTVDLVPHGVESRKRTIGTLTIRNTGTGTEEVGNYKAVLNAEYMKGDGRSGQVFSFHRKNRSVWSLVGAFLKLFGHTTHPPRLMRK